MKFKITRTKREQQIKINSLFVKLKKKNHDTVPEENT